jgi:hypothetical protein
MSNILNIILIVAIWIVLVKVVLPRLGIQP